jgi:hypothetical protein
VGLRLDVPVTFFIPPPVPTTSGSTERNQLPRAAAFLGITWPVVVHSRRYFKIFSWPTTWMELQLKRWRLCSLASVFTVAEFSLTFAVIQTPFTFISEIALERSAISNLMDHE